MVLCIQKFGLHTTGQVSARWRVTRSQTSLNPLDKSQGSLWVDQMKMATSPHFTWVCRPLCPKPFWFGQPVTTAEFSMCASSWRDQSLRYVVYHTTNTKDRTNWYTMLVIFTIFSHKTSWKPRPDFISLHFLRRTRNWISTRMTSRVLYLVTYIRKHPAVRIRAFAICGYIIFIHW